MTGVGVVYPTTQLVNAKSRYLIGLKTNSLVPRPESRRFGSDLKPQIVGFYFDLDVKILVLAGKEDKILVLVPVSKVRCRLTSLRSASAVLTVVPCLSVCLSPSSSTASPYHSTTSPFSRPPTSSLTGNNSSTKSRFVAWLLVVYTVYQLKRAKNWNLYKHDTIRHELLF